MTKILSTKSFDNMEFNLKTIPRSLDVNYNFLEKHGSTNNLLECIKIVVMAVKKVIESFIKGTEITKKCCSAAKNIFAPARF